MSYTVYELARLANAVYDASRTEVDGWREQARFGSSTRGFYGALYQREERFVLALRGTDDGFDVIPDAEIFASLVPIQLAEAQKALNESLLKARKRKLVLTGHSLGGGLAGLLASQYSKHAVTFNAPGVARSYGNLVSVAGGILPDGALQAVYMAWTTTNSTTLINIRANFDAVSVGTGPRLGRVDSISVGGCSDTWDEFGARFAQLPMDMIMNRPSGQFEPFGGMIEEVTKYVLCQHGMDLMERQLSKMPEYQQDLGW